MRMNMRGIDGVAFTIHMDSYGSKLDLAGESLADEDDRPMRADADEELDRVSMFVLGVETPRFTEHARCLAPDLGRVEHNLEPPADTH